MTKRPLSRPLGPGTRVRHATDAGLVGKVVSSRAVGTHWVYHVHWDGNDHDSGQYGIRSLIRVNRG